MFVLKPTLSKAYFTLILLVSLLCSLVLSWFYQLTIAEYDMVVSLVAMGGLTILGVLVCVVLLLIYSIACMSTMLLTPFLKETSIWRPSFSKTMLAMLLECLLWIVIWRLVFTSLTVLAYLLFPLQQAGLNPCPVGPFISLCTISFPTLQENVVLLIISLANAYISYTLSCLIKDFIGKLKSKEK